MKQSENIVWIEGILSEVNLKNGSYVKEGKTVEYISGDITVLVEQEVNGIPEESFIPVSFFSNRYSNDGKVNPSYENLSQVLTNYTSIAACGDKEKADKVRITKGAIDVNDFPNREGKMVSTQRVRASFVSKVVGEFTPQARFWVDLYLVESNPAVDEEGAELEPKKLNTRGLLIGWKDRVDVVNFVATSPNTIDVVQGLEPNHIYHLTGRLNFAAQQAVKKVSAGGFGESTEKPFTKVNREFIITGGNDIPLEDEFTPTEEEIRTALAARKVRIEQTIEKAKNRTKATPAPVAKAGLDLGF